MYLTLYELNVVQPQHFTAHSMQIIRGEAEKLGGEELGSLGRSFSPCTSSHLSPLDRRTLKKELIYCRKISVCAKWDKLLMLIILKTS